MRRLAETKISTEVLLSRWIVNSYEVGIKSLLTMSSLDMTFDGLVSSMRLAVASSSLPSTSPPV